MKKAILFFILFVFFAKNSFSQILYKDSMFAVTKEAHQFYGLAINFAGGTDSLFLDIYKPIGNRISCRPLVVFVHGGAFIAGSSDDVFESAMANYFASTGFMTVSINYRLNNFKRSFYTPYAFCNDAIYPPGFSKCVYVADTAEVIRALFRAQQDAKGALRYLARNASGDSLNLNNIFLAGTSAGAITCLTAAFSDRNTEKQPSVLSIDSALAPDPYLASCMPVTYLLSRPDLGDINGELNLDMSTPDIKGIASFYGAVEDYSIIDTAYSPYLYLYHRTHDPIVDSGTRQAISGLYDYCYNPTNICEPLDHWPYLHGNFALSNYLQRIHYPASKIMTRIVPNSNFCDGQGHSIDDWKLRSDEVMTFFNDEVLRNQMSCSNTGLEIFGKNRLEIYPNPVTSSLTLLLKDNDLNMISASICSMDGRMQYFRKMEPVEHNYCRIMNLDNLGKGTYLLICKLSNGREIRSMIVLN